MGETGRDRFAARLAVVEEHIRCENRGDLNGLMATFGNDASYEDGPWRDRRAGRPEVRAYYAELLHAIPDLAIEVQRRHVTKESVMLEVIIRGIHQGAWRGLPGTGRKLDFPLCAVYTFDESDRLAGERIYYDRATVLRQLGLFREPLRGPGRIALLLNHPLTIARAYLHRIFSTDRGTRNQRS